MAEQNLVICRNCIHRDTTRKNCVIWYNAVSNPETTIVQTRDLFHDELGGIAFTNVDMPRFCRHFSGNYPFVVGE